ncbi:MAG: serine hydrolase [Betaproteobacteria bacterium]|nr:serine hydrolase [Betaproteobacteria bacterium]
MFLALFLTCATLAQPLTAAPPLDPARLMQGFPPPPTYQVNIANWQAYPQKIWAFQHVRELFPTRLLPHTGPVQPLPHALKTLDELVVSAKGESRMTWPEMLKVTHTDAIVVLYHGRIIYERYFNNMAPESRHLLFSATKSMAGLMAATLVSEGKLDENAKVSDIIPELAESAWADATVRQVMDMTDGVAFSENYTDPKSDIYRYAAAMGWAPQFKNPTDPDGILPMLATLKAQRDERGSVFRYHSPATDVAAWLAMRAAGQSLTAWLTDRLWSKLSARKPMAIFSSIERYRGRLRQAVLVHPRPCARRTNAAKGPIQQ